MTLQTISVIFGLVFACSSEHVLGTESEMLPSFYHTSDAVLSEIHRLGNKCQGMTLEKYADPDDAGVQLDAVRVRLPGEGSGHRVAMVAGEHARELITVETTLNFLKGLCGERGTESGAGSLGEDVDGSSFAGLSGTVSELLVFPNANPSSRRKVEAGDFCLRANEHDVDLNRNWDTHWSSVSGEPPGTKPFSEPESRILRDAIKGYQPTIYVSVHSGNLGVFAPYAYDKDAPPPRAETVSLLEKVSREYCQCPFGGAARTIGYDSPGTSLDYVYDVLKVPNSYATEIWIGEQEQAPFHLRYEAQEAAYRGKDTKVLASLLERREASAAKMRKTRRHVTRRDTSSPEWCLQNFNPTTQEKYKDVLNRWTDAFVKLIKESPSPAASPDAAAPK